MTRSFEHPWVDSTRAPVYLLQVPDDPSARDVATFCKVMEQFVADSNTRIAWVTDLGRLHKVGAVQRRTFIEANQRVESLLAGRFASIAVYAPRPFQRGLVTVFKWFIRLPFAFEVFSDLEEALHWSAQQLPTAKSEIRKPSGIQF